MFIGVIKAVTPPLTVGLYGPWGSGKSTMISGIVEQLQKENCLTLVFDAWKYRHESNLVLPLMCALENSLSPVVCREGKITLLERLHDWCRSRKKELPLLGSLGLVLSNQYIKENIGVDLYEAEAEAKKRVLRQYEQYEDNVRKIDCEYSEFIDACLKKANKRDGSKNLDRVVLFIDNLDRCLPDVVVSLLEDISSFLSVGGVPCVYVLAMDKDNVIKAVNHRYPDFDGAHYLEKIVQVPLKMPFPQQNSKGDGSAGRYHFMKRYEWGRMYKTDSASGDSRDKVFKELASVDSIFNGDILGNPRRIERIVNKLMLLESSKFFEAEKNPADISGLIFLLLLAEYFPNVYEALKEETDINYLFSVLAWTQEKSGLPINKRKERDQTDSRITVPNEVVFNTYCDNSKFFLFMRGFVKLVNIPDSQKRLKRLKDLLNYIG